MQYVIVHDLFNSLMAELDFLLTFADIAGTCLSLSFSLCVFGSYREGEGGRVVVGNLDLFGLFFISIVF